MIRSTHRIFGALAWIAALGACAASRVEPAPPAPSAAAAPDPEPQRPTGMTGALVGSHPTGDGSALPAPAEGTSRSAVTGCLAAATEAEGQRFAPPPVTRSAGPAVTVTAIPGGIAVTHQLTHACCLKGELSTRIDGASVVIREVLTGTPCRCMCASTLRTAVGLAPGHWSVAVALEEDGRVTPIALPPVDVPKG